MNWKRFGKATVGLLGVVLTSLSRTHWDNPYVEAVIMIATMLGIYEVPYVPKEPRDVF